MNNAGAIVESFFHGSLSFFSTCVLPLLPGFAALVIGRSCQELQKSGDRSPAKAALRDAGWYVGGFLLMCMSIGFDGSDPLYRHLSQAVKMIGGTATSALGIAWLVQRSPAHRNQAWISPITSVMAFVFGISSAAVWIPCVSPALSEILHAASAASSRRAGLLLLTSYEVGFGCVLMVLAGLLSRVYGVLRSPPSRAWGQRFAGAVLLVMGIAILEGHLNFYMRWMSVTP